MQVKAQVAVSAQGAFVEELPLLVSFGFYLVILSVNDAALFTFPIIV